MILEHGIKKESGKASKISVFNGPVFSDDDPVFGSIQIPLEFWKIILWYNDNDELRATAFTLSQSDLVDGIQFEELDFDTNAEFAEYQCSIRSLAKKTKINFSDLYDLDTFDNNNPNESFKISSEEQFEAFIKADAKK